MSRTMITTAAQAFTFCSGSVGSRADLPESQRYAHVFETIADLCRDIPAELPGPQVVAFALLHIGQREGYTEAWRDVGQKLGARALGIDDPEIIVAYSDKRRLPEAIWLWQMLIHACECRIAMVPQIMQNNRGQLAIQNGSLLQPISQLDAQAIQQQRQVYAILAAGLRGELRVLIEALCPERTEAIRKAVAEQVAKMETGTLVA